MKKVLPIILACAGVADAKPAVNGKVSLTGLYYIEQDLPSSANGLPVLASPAQLGFGDARFLLNANRLIRDRLDIRIDMRVRASGSFDFERKFSLEPLAAPPTTVTARGYLGGPEYELREAYVGLKLGDRVRLQLGRMFIPEGDMLKTDALRLQVRFTDRWSGSLFAGGSPNPYSRSLLTDYEPPCGNGVASGSGSLKLDMPIAPTPGTIPAARGACTTEGPQLALAAGLTASYNYSLLEGSVALVGTFFGGNGDGGAALVDPTRANTVGNLLAPSAERDAPRIYATWVNQLHPWERFDLFSSLVVDLSGSGGAQLTRAMLAGNLRLLPQDRLTLRLSYTHMSSLAINMFLNRQLYDRVSNGSTLAGLGIVENNLTVLRTGRDEVRLNTDLKVVARLQLYLEGRLRHRSLMNGDSNPAVYESPLYEEQTRNLAGDFTVGLRDGGSLNGLRVTLSYMFLQDFRSRSHVLRTALGRSFWRDRFSVDADYVAILVSDGGAGGTDCNVNQFFPAGGQQVISIDPKTSVFLADCYGRRIGVTHDAGLTLTLNPWRKLFFLADYRFTALLTDPQRVQAGTTSFEQAVPTVLAHSILARAELGF